MVRRKMTHRWVGFVSLFGATGAAAQTVIYSNGPFVTGPVTQSGVAAPAGTVWSEVARDCCDPTTANTVSGFLALQGTRRLADDFRIVDPGGWRITGLRVMAHQTGSTTTSTITGCTLRIWAHDPSLGGEPIFGDTTTNRLVDTDFSGVYRCFNTVVPPGNGSTTPPTLTRPLMNVDVGLDVTLSAGRYWVDWALSGSLSVGPWCTPVTIANIRQPVPDANALQFVDGDWIPAMDPGQGFGPYPAPQDLVFELTGEVLCYANCDGTTAGPLLSANDFACFLDRYTVGSTLANCDLSSGAPILTPNDFTCFLNQFAAGCS